MIMKLFNISASNKINIKRLCCLQVATHFLFPVSFSEKKEVLLKEDGSRNPDSRTKIHKNK